MVLCLCVATTSERTDGLPADHDALKQNVDDVAILIDCTPKVFLLAVDSHEKFVHMPAIAETLLPLPKAPCIVSRKLLTPTSNGFVDCDAAFGKKIFNISEAHARSDDRPTRRN
jgi:hypothetical protein